MKHLHFVQALDPLKGGGMGAAALELHKEFLRLGVKSHLVSTRLIDEEPNETPGVTQFVRRGMDRTFYVPRLGKLAIDLVQDADVIHSNGFYVDLHRVFGSMAITFEKPLVSHVHGIFDPWHLARSRRKKLVAEMLFERRNRRYTSLWRSLTATESAAIRSRGVTAPIVVAPNGVQSEDYEPLGNSSVRRHDKALLFLGRLHPQKGIDLLLRAWAESDPMLSDWTLTIVGPDRNGYRSDLEALTRQLDVSGSVKFVGPLRGPAKIDVLHSSTALIVPSRSEGFPMVILEAMASELPVIATRNTNVAEIEAHGVGFECEATVDSLTKVLSRIHHTTSDEFAAMGSRASDWVRRDFTWTATANRILDATDAIL